MQRLRIRLKTMKVTLMSSYMNAPTHYPTHNTHGYTDAAEIVKISETADMQTRSRYADMQTQTEEFSSTSLVEKPPKPANDHVTLVEEEAKKSLLEHLRTVPASGYILQYLITNLGKTELYPDVGTIQSTEMKRIAIQNSLKSLETGGLLGSALTCLLPLGGRVIGMNLRFLAPLTIMAIAEAKYRTENFESQTSKYVMRLWRGTLEEDLDCCVNSRPNSVLAVLSTIGAPVEAKKRRTMPVSYTYRNVPNLISGEDISVVHGIKVSRVRRICLMACCERINFVGYGYDLSSLRRRNELNQSIRTSGVHCAFPYNLGVSQGVQTPLRRRNELTHTISPLRFLRLQTHTTLRGCDE